MSISIDNLIETIKKEAEKHYSDDPSHDWLHAERVCKMCMRICEKEGGDPKVLVAAALLHDVGMRYELEQGVDHSEKSVEIAGEILSRIGFPKDKISMVLEAISVHRFRKRVRAVSIESKILQDADRLDGMGAIGVARTFSYGGRRGIPMYSRERCSESTIGHFYEKLLKLKDNLNTETARRIAEGRHAFIEAFLSRFLKEIEGEA
ncbi:MAG: HD domain-containing protein [Thermoproteota archaeon]